jgi:SAM-dependent methyltransferase
MSGGVNGGLIGRWNSRIAPLFWSTDYIPGQAEVSLAHQHVSQKTGSRAYPIRTVRYWMTIELIRQELENRKRVGEEKIVIAELGCNRGQVIRFAGEMARAGEWIGLDFNEECRLEAISAGFKRFICADFDQALPLADDSADIIVFIHVLEHLPRPEFTMSEIARVLKPGGLLVAGSPVLPWPYSVLRDRVLKKRLETGKIKPGAHIQALSRSSWKKLLRRAFLEPEFMNGAYLLRWSGCPLEDYSFWFRLNVAWGALFPQLGNEIYLTARKVGLSN